MKLTLILIMSSLMASVAWGNDFSSEV